MDCLESCRQGAITYTRRQPERASASRAESPRTDASRRRFFGVVGLFAYTALRAQEKKVDGGLAVIEQKKIPRRTTPITPPGSLAVRNMEAHCTGCQLCVAVCPN